MADSYNLIDRCLGAYIGAALGDALGGPIEGWHAATIKATYGRVDHLLPYDPARLRPGYAMHPEPGSITDDTYIRSDFTRFVLANPDERTPEMLVEYLLANASFDFWWRPAIEPLRRIQTEEVSVQEAGIAHRQGGGAGWWTPFGLIWAGQPEKAAAEVRRLSVVWKQPLEQHLCGALQAAAAASVAQGATIESIVEAALSVAGPLGRALIARGLDAAKRHRGDLDGLIEDIYSSLLVMQVGGEVDGPMPEPAVAPDPSQRQGSILFAEQVPLAMAAFVFGRGDFLRTMTSVAAIGRDTDSIATSCGTWIGGLVGLAGIPADWTEAVTAANRRDVDLMEHGHALAGMAAR